MNKVSDESKILNISFITLVIFSVLMLTGCLALETATQAFDCSVVSEIPHSECEALVVLHQSTQESSYWRSTNGSRWLKSDKPCNWDSGIQCQSGNVVGLHMAQLELKGVIPSELGQLTSLRKLNLLSNSFTGNIPLELGNISSLEELELQNNQLSGELPAELGNLTKLIRFSITDNNLHGTIPSEIGNMHSLKILELDFNKFDGDIPNELGDLEYLERLALAGNTLEGSIPLEKLSNLRSFTLD